MPHNRPSIPVTQPASLPFLSFPPEIRLKIYSYLLHSKNEIPVWSGLFKRNRRTLTTLSSLKVYKFCKFCDCGFKTASSYTSHRYSGCWASSYADRNLLWQMPEQGAGLTLNILATCRIIHTEATPILYRSNKIRFQTPAALNCWRWSTDTKLAASLQRLSILLSWGYAAPGDPMLSTDRYGWWRYLEKSRFNLAQDFPHLKGLSVILDKAEAVVRAETVALNFRKFRECMYGLDWVQVVGLDEEELLSVLYPIVERPLEGNGVKGVRVKIEEYERVLGWKSATIWWGEAGEEAPCAAPDFARDEQYRHQLCDLES